MDMEKDKVPYLFIEFILDTFEVVAQVDVHNKLSI